MKAKYIIKKNDGDYRMSPNWNFKRVWNYFLRDSKGFLHTSSNRDEWKIIEETETDSIRQQAAIAAMQGILSNADGFEFLYKENERHTIPTGVARLAIACADELIKQLKPKKQ